MELPSLQILLSFSLQGVYLEGSRRTTLRRYRYRETWTERGLGDGGPVHRTLRLITTHLRVRAGGQHWVHRMGIETRPDYLLVNHIEGGVWEFVIVAAPSTSGRTQDCNEGCFLGCSLWIGGMPSLLLVKQSNPSFALSVISFKIAGPCPNPTEDLRLEA